MVSSRRAYEIVVMLKNSETTIKTKEDNGLKVSAF